MKRTRKFFGMSQEQMGSYAKVNRSYIGQVERGDRSISSSMYMQLQHLIYLEGKFADIEAPLPSQPQDPEQVLELLKGYRRDLMRVEKDLANMKAMRDKWQEKLRAHRMKALLVESLLLLGENERELASNLQIDLRRDNRAGLEAELYKADARIPTLEREAAELAQHIAHLEKTAAELEKQTAQTPTTLDPENETTTAVVGNRELNVAYMKNCIAIGQWFARNARYERILRAHGGRKRKSASIIARHILGEPEALDPQLLLDQRKLCKEMEKEQRSHQAPDEIPPDNMVQPIEHILLDEVPHWEVPLGRVA